MFTDSLIWEMYTVNKQGRVGESREECLCCGRAACLCVCARVPVSLCGGGGKNTVGINELNTVANENDIHLKIFSIK